MEIQPQFFVGWADVWVCRRKSSGFQHVPGRCCYVPALPEFRFWYFLDEDNDCYTIVEQESGMSLGPGQPSRYGLHHALSLLYQELGLKLVRKKVRKAIKARRKEVASA